VSYCDRGGLLGVQLELVGRGHGPVQRAVDAAFDRMRTDALELAVAGLAVYLVWLAPELLARAPEG
jgi:hypothetical protein